MLTELSAAFTLYSQSWYVRHRIQHSPHTFEMQSSSRSAGLKYGIASWARTPSRQRAKSSGSTRIATNLCKLRTALKLADRLSPCTTHPLFPAGHPGRPRKKTPPDQAANGLQSFLQRLQSHSATSSLVSAQATVLFSESVGRPRPGRSGCLTSFMRTPSRATAPRWR